MGDGRFDSAQLIDTIKQNAQAQWLFDFDELARRNQTMLNAVMLGTLAGCGRLPLPPEAFESAIREVGRAVESNLRGFRARLAKMQAADGPAAKLEDATHAISAPPLAGIEQQVAARMPAASLDVICQGVRRLAHYQDVAYAQLYIDRLQTINEADHGADMG